MTKRAFCVGINDYPIEGADLRGCVNDAEGWASLLVDHFDFAPGDVRLMKDSEATKKNMLAGVKGLLAGARYGDVLVFTNSSHGSYIPDTTGDEKDRYDEVICPYDIRDNALVDDELRELFADLPRGVRLTVISDSCHSGNVTRVIPSEILPGLRFADDRRPRFLSPVYWASPDRRSRDVESVLLADAPRAAVVGHAAAVTRDVESMLLPDALGAKPARRARYPESKMRDVLLSGCRDVELSYDANIGGSFHGAMSYHAVKAISDARYTITYEELAERLGRLLDDTGYPQHPQLEGKREAKGRQIFT